MRRWQRFCLRLGKDICWECCNNLRIDQKCPSECKYCLIENEGTFKIKTNIDSTTEYRDLLKKLFDRWAMLPQEELGGKIPMDLTMNREGIEKLTAFVKEFDLSRYPEAEYVFKKFKITDIALPPKLPDPEEKAIEIAKLLMIKDYESIADYHYYSDNLSNDKDLYDDFLLSLRQDKVLKKIKDTKLVSAAQSENHQEAIIYFDVNNKYDLILRMKKVGDDWKFWQRIMGKMEIVNGEAEACKQLGYLISQKQLAKASELFDKYLSLYPDSGNMHYLKGIYEKIHGRENKARAFFLRATRLEPDFSEALVNYSSCLYMDGEIEKALTQLHKADNLQTDDVRIKNNIAVIYLERKNYEKAEKYLNECLKIDAEYKPALMNVKRLEELTSN